MSEEGNSNCSARALTNRGFAPLHVCTLVVQGFDVTFISQLIVQRTTTMADSDSLTLRVSGLGHKLTFDMKPSSTVGEVKAEIEKQTSLPAAYQRLIVHGKKLEDDSVTLTELDIQHRTRVMLLHNETYAADKEGAEAISALVKEMDELASSSSRTAETVHELVTQICCKLDAVDTHGSETLRVMRKNAMAKAEELSSSSPSSSSPFDDSREMKRAE